MTTPDPLTDFMADRCFDLEFAARFEPEVNLVEHRTGDPSPLCHPRDGGETHPGCMADDLKDVRNGLNAVDYSNMFLELPLVAQPQSPRVQVLSALSGITKGGRWCDVLLPERTASADRNRTERAGVR